MNPYWLVPVVGRILVANGIFPAVLKRNVGLHSRTKRFFLQYLFCSILAVAVAIAVGSLTVNPVTAGIVALGFFNGLAAYAQWKAIDISLSRTSLFTFWDDLIAMALSYVILHEGRVLTLGGYAGIVLSFGAVILFAVHTYQKKASGSTARINPRFFLYVAFYSVIWGVATFLMKYFGYTGVPTGTFMAAWYVGAFIAAIVLLFTYRDQTPASGERLAARDAAWMLVLAACIMAALALGYWSYRMAPQNVVQPLFLVGEMIVPTLIGLYVFSERKGLVMKEKIYFALAIVGGLLVAFSFR